MKRANSLLLLAVVSLLAGCKSGTAGKIVSVSVSPTGVNIGDVDRGGRQRERHNIEYGSVYRAGDSPGSGTSDHHGHFAKGHDQVGVSYVDDHDDGWAVEHHGDSVTDGGEPRKFCDRAIHGHGDGHHEYGRDLAGKWNDRRQPNLGIHIGCGILRGAGKRAHGFERSGRRDRDHADGEGGFAGRSDRVGLIDGNDRAWESK